VARNSFDPDGKEGGRLSRKGSVVRRIEVGHGPSQVGLAPEVAAIPRFLLATGMARMQIKMLPQRPWDYREFSRSRTQPQRWLSVRSPDRARDVCVASRPLPRRFGMKRPGKGSLPPAGLAAGSASSSGLGGDLVLFLILDAITRRLVDGIHRRWVSNRSAHGCVATRNLHGVSIRGDPRNGQYSIILLPRKRLRFSFQVLTRRPHDIHRVLAILVWFLAKAEYGILSSRRSTPLTLGGGKVEPIEHWLNLEASRRRVGKGKAAR
jgi:hypothetical protein